MRLLFIILFCLIAGCTNQPQEATTTSLPATSTTLPPFDCAAAKGNITGVIESANHCERDEDCLLLDYNCPFGCRGVNAKADLSSLTAGIEEYYKKCGACNGKCVGDMLLCDTGRCVQAVLNVGAFAPEYDFKTPETPYITVKNKLNRSVFLQECEDITVESRYESRWNNVPMISCPDDDLEEIESLSDYNISLGSFNMTAARYQARVNVWVRCLKYPETTRDCGGNITLATGEFRIK